jgi:hypothetical protein
MAAPTTISALRAETCGQTSFLQEPFAGQGMFLPG